MNPGLAGRSGLIATPQPPIGGAKLMHHEVSIPKSGCCKHATCVALYLFELWLCVVSFLVLSPFFLLSCFIYSIDLCTPFFFGGGGGVMSIRRNAILPMTHVASSSDDDEVGKSSSCIWLVPGQAARGAALFPCDRIPEDAQNVIPKMSRLSTSLSLRTSLTSLHHEYQDLAPQMPLQRWCKVPNAEKVTLENRDHTAKSWVTTNELDQRSFRVSASPRLPRSHPQNPPQTHLPPARWAPYTRHKLGAKYPARA